MTEVQNGTRLDRHAEQDPVTTPIRIPPQAPLGRTVPSPTRRPVTHHQAPPPAGMPYPGAVAPQAARNGFGITALCLAIPALVFMMMPITGFLAVILGGLALIFGLLGWGRARRGHATNGKMAITGTALGALGLIMGIVGVVMMFQITAQLGSDLEQIGNGLPAAAPVPEVGVPAAAAPAAATGYTYEVTGNYRGMITYTESNGDMVSLDGGDSIDTMGTELPWTRDVTPEPNGNAQTLSGSTMSDKGDSWVTCTVKDDAGTVVATETGRGAYASCYASTLF